MVPQSTLITSPSVNFGTLISTCNSALRHSVTGGVDNTVKKISDAERLLTILSAFKDDKARVCLPPNLLPHTSFSVLTIASELDMLDILECCAGMPFTTAETKMRGVNLAYTSGTMQQWRDAVVAGCDAERQDAVRQGFNNIHNLFVGVGLGSIWNDFQQKPLRGSYTLIEYRPN